MGCDHRVVNDAQILDIEGIEIMKLLRVESSGNYYRSTVSKVS